MKLYVSLPMLEQQLSKMKDLCDEFYERYGSLFSKIDESALYWKGKDQQAFVSTIHGFEDDFNRLHRMLCQYCEFLEKGVYAYRVTQDEAEASSYRLIQ